MSHIELAFRPLHTTLARIGLLSRLADENVSLPAALQQDLCDWLQDLVSEAQEQAIKAEEQTAGVQTGAR